MEYNYPQSNLKQEHKQFQLRLNIIKFFIILSAIVLMINTAIAWYDEAGEMVAVCPESGCVFQDRTYYADFEEDSKEYWHSFCTNLPDKCTKTL